MKAIRSLLIAALLIPVLPAQAADEPSDSSLGHVLTLVHTFVRMAAESDSSAVSLRAIDEVLAGRNAAANEAIAGLMREALADVSPENRATIAAIGRDLVGVARKNLLGLKPGETLYPDRSLQARKELNALGLTYHDSRQFLDAVKRNDTLAAEGDDERAPAEVVHVRRDLAEPADEAIGVLHVIFSNSTVKPSGERCGEPFVV